MDAWCIPAGIETRTVHLCTELKSPELIEQAQTTVLIIYAALKCSLFHNMKDESKINRLICKLQNFAKKDESIKTQQLPVSISHSGGVCVWWD